MPHNPSLNQQPVYVVDPAVRKPELEAFNHLAGRSPVPLSYHLPALYGMDSIQKHRLAPRGIIVFGSASSVHERTSWQIALETWLKPHLLAGVPTLGICYGHQLLHYLFGGKVTYHHPQKEKLVEFREVKLQADRLWGNKPLAGTLYYSHNEIVSAPAPDFEEIGTSARFTNEAHRHRSLPIWTFQAHPETLRGEGPLAAQALAFGASLMDNFLNFVRETQTR